MGHGRDSLFRGARRELLAILLSRGWKGLATKRPI